TTTDSAQVTTDLPPRAPTAPPSPSATSPGPKNPPPPPNADGGPNSGSSGKKCPADAPGQEPWKPPPAYQNACTTSDVAFFAKQYATVSTWTDLENAMKTKSTKCTSC